VEHYGKSFNSGRKALEKAGFRWIETTETGRRVFRNPATKAEVYFDSGKALVPGQDPPFGTYVDLAGKPMIESEKKSNETQMRGTYQRTNHE
jgi:hypothetical protein